MHGGCFGNLKSTPFNYFGRSTEGPSFRAVKEQIFYSGDLNLIFGFEDSFLGFFGLLETTLGQ